MKIQGNGFKITDIEGVEGASIGSSGRTLSIRTPGGAAVNFTHEHFLALMPALREAERLLRENVPIPESVTANEPEDRSARFRDADGDIWSWSRRYVSIESSGHWCFLAVGDHADTCGYNTFNELRADYPSALEYIR